MMNFRRNSSKRNSGANTHTAAAGGGSVTLSKSPSSSDTASSASEEPTTTQTAQAPSASSPPQRRKGSTRPAMKHRTRTASVKARRNMSAISEDQEVQTFTDMFGRDFTFNTVTGVAYINDDFKLWPRTLGPLELSSRRAQEDRKRLSVKYRELDAYGCVSRHEYLPGLTPGTLDKQLSKHTGMIMRQEIQTSIRHHQSLGGEIKRVATRVLECLEYCLPVVRPYHYEAFHPSHKWATGPDGHDYLREFYSLIPALCAAAIRVLKQDEMVIDLESPCYVLGDLHGNLRDLQYFAAQFWRSGVDICPSDLLFLGDYVDRGPHSTEVVAYLLALKVLYPKKVFLLRGNHELESVCGNVDYYGEGSFRAQLMAHALRCGLQDSFEDTWDALMMCFDWMPLAATIDKNIFCCHAGLPRAVMEKYDGQTTIMDRIKSLPRPLIEEEHIDGTEDCIAMDILWADPATAREKHIMGKHGLPKGFALNLERGGDACVFGDEAVNKFSEETSCNFILRAHQPPNRGIRYQAGARVITVFSSSHYCGMNNAAALIVVSKDQLDIVTTGQTTSRDKVSEGVTKL